LDHGDRVRATGPLRPLTLPLLLLVSACAPVGGASGTCADYAAEVRALLGSGATASEIGSFLDGTEERVARLVIDAGAENAQPCVDAVFEATFTMADRDFAEQLAG